MDLSSPIIPQGLRQILQYKGQYNGLRIDCEDGRNWLSHEGAKEEKIHHHTPAPCHLPTIPGCFAGKVYIPSPLSFPFVMVQVWVQLYCWGINTDLNAKQNDSYLKVWSREQLPSAWSPWVPWETAPPFFRKEATAPVGNSFEAWALGVTFRHFWSLHLKLLALG